MTRSRQACEDGEDWTPAVARFPAAGDRYEQEAVAFRAPVDRLPVDLPDEAKALPRWTSSRSRRPS